jgi:hypothetical protein
MNRNIVAENYKFGKVEYYYAEKQKSGALIANATFQHSATKTLTANQRSRASRVLIWKPENKLRITSLYLGLWRECLLVIS